MNQVYWFRSDFGFEPTKDHLGVAVDLLDVQPRTYEFLRELSASITNWVYGKERVKAILKKRLEMTGGDVANAAAYLTQMAQQKFRPGHPQGQLGELLLFNFIRFFFGAEPLLRKMRIATSSGHERFGADAIHYKKESEEHLFFLGEAKCYTSDHSFAKAFKSSVISIKDTFDNLQEELDLYVSEDFIEPEFQSVVDLLKTNSLTSTKFEFVCLVAYNEGTDLRGDNTEKLRERIKEIILTNCATLQKDVFASLEKIATRMNFIVFPIWQIDKLLTDFGKRIGVERG